jgi:hypothetical protein
MLVAMRAVQRWLLQVNLFESDFLDEETVQNQRLSFWLLIAVSIAILVSLSVFTGVARQTSSVTINNTTRDTFKDLSQKYPKTLSCPCSNTAISFSKFVQFDVTYHQVGTMTA